MVLALGIIGAYLFFRLGIYDKKSSSPQRATEITTVVNFPSNPIQKVIKPDGTRVKYTVLGSFISDIQPSERILDSAYSGEFVIKGDPLDRIIPIIIGKGTGLVTFGVYEGDFNSKSVWKAYSPEEAKQELVLGEEIQLTIGHDIPSSGNIPENILNAQEILDNLFDDFNSGEHNYNIPQELQAFEVSGIGVVR